MGTQVRAGRAVSQKSEGQGGATTEGVPVLLSGWACKWAYLVSRGADPPEGGRIYSCISELNTAPILSGGTQGKITTLPVYASTPWETISSSRPECLFFSLTVMTIIMGSLSGRM